jgi:exopolysaccharide production protein ExoQ
MPPSIALLLWFALLLLLLRFDPAKEAGTNLALWAPLMWVFFVGSRLPSQWLEGQLGTTAGAFEEGNPLDRAVFTGLILLMAGILISRSFNWGGFFARNFFLMAFLAFALVSILWSDFPFVAFKRWFRDLGSYLAVLVVLSDPAPLNAVRTLFRRFCYLLIPLSIVLIKYYPHLSVWFNEWTGTAMYGGATTGKNSLGAACMISGMFFFWDTLTRWPDRKDRRTKRILLLNIAFIAMTLWLLNLATSSTSRVCLALGCLIIAAANLKTVKRHPNFIKVLVPSSFCLYLIAALGFGLNGDMAAAVGRNPSLTDRTPIWKALLAMKTNALIGTGYESFWLGPRVNVIWQQFGRLNEAHNGYLEVYLNLGIIGLFLLCVFLIASYRNICKGFTSSPSASLTLALWAVILFYNITEAAFVGYHLMWITLLFGAIAVPEYAERSIPIVLRSHKLDPAKRFAQPVSRVNAQKTRNLASRSKPYPPLR